MSEVSKTTPTHPIKSTPTTGESPNAVTTCLCCRGIIDAGAVAMCGECVDVQMENAYEDGFEDARTMEND